MHLTTYTLSRGQFIQSWDVYHILHFAKILILGVKIMIENY